MSFPRLANRGLTRFTSSMKIVVMPKLMVTIKMTENFLAKENFIHQLNYLRKQSRKSVVALSISLLMVKPLPMKMTKN